MYFNASERIANRTNIARKTIEQFDEFLARPRSIRFSAYELQAMTGLKLQNTSLLNEYVRERILRERKIYKCPVHDIELDSGYCIDCEKKHPLDDCPSKQVYERVAEPDKEFVNSQDKSILFEKQKPWWKTRDFWIRDFFIIVIIGGIVVGFVSSFFSSLFNSKPTSENQIVITSTPNTKIIMPEATTDSLLTMTPSMNITAKGIIVVTSEPTQKTTDTP
jgi:hypothetical protein